MTDVSSDTDIKKIPLQVTEKSNKNGPTEREQFSGC